MAVWDSQYLKSLPNSSFAFIDAQGGRHLPYKDKNGKVDRAHVVDALARLDQTQGIPAGEVAAIRTKLQNALKQAHSAELSVQLSDSRDALQTSVNITADANGKLPSRFQLLTTFDLPNSNRGHFTVTPQDLDQIKEKFDAGIGFPSGDPKTGLAIDYHHDDDKDAAAWIHSLDVVRDPNDDSKATLYADNVEWTDAGAQAVQGGRYKMISPTGAFGRRDGKLSSYPWHTNLKDKISNFICGAGLTNIPFQSMMEPIKLSAHGDNVVFYISDNENNKETSMELDKLRVKDRKDLTVEELDHLAANTEKLDADELKKFKLEKTDPETLSAEDKETLEAIKSGKKKVVDPETLDAKVSDEERETLSALKAGTKKVVDTAVADKLDRLDSLEKTAEQYRHEKAEQLVGTHVERGAIKPTEAENWTQMLLTADDDTRVKLEKSLKALPSNEKLTKELGHSEDVNVDVRNELKEKTLELQAKAQEDKRNLSYAQAQAELLSRDTKLKARVDALMAGTKG